MDDWVNECRLDGMGWDGDVFAQMEGNQLRYFTTANRDDMDVALNSCHCYADSSC